MPATAEHDNRVKRTGSTATSPFDQVAPATSPERELLDNLYAADNWAAVVRLLHDDLGLAKNEIARAADVAPITVTRWLDAGEDADVRSPGRLDDLRYVVLALLKQGAMSKKLLRFWLVARDVQLRTDALSAIAAGRFEEVVEAGMALSSLRRLPD